MSQKQDKERDDMSQKQDTERDDPYVRRRNREPTNCSPGDTVQDDEPYKKAKRYIERNPASHCCTIKGRKVKQWRLVPPNAKVRLRDRDGTTFYYDSTHLPLD